MDKKEDYIGRYFKGFEFGPQYKKNGCISFSYNKPCMDKLIGRTLEIQGYVEVVNSFTVKDDHDTWHYPVKETIENLIEIKEEELFDKVKDLFNKVKK
jgi:hypothetical protein